MALDEHRPKVYHLKMWQRSLIIGIVVALSSQLYLAVWAEGFRVSASSIVYPVLLMTMMRNSHRPTTGVVVGICVMGLRTVLDLLAGGTLLHTLTVEYPGGVFYVCYDCLLCLLIRDRRSASYGGMGAAFFLCDLCSNVVNLALSGGLLAGAMGDTLGTLAMIAVLRASSAALIMWAMGHYRQLLLQQEHERRYQRLFIMTADLKNELYFLKKDSEDIESVMSRAYRLYERLGELGLPEEEKSMALSIAREVHEIKKDNLRIIRGIEGEVADVYDQEEMRVSDLFRILQDSTRRLLGQQRSEIRLECWCGKDVKVREHYRILSIVKNLVTNAIEAIQSDTGRGTVRVEQSVSGDMLVLRVTDDGPGIKPRPMANLLQVGYSTKFDPATGNISRGVGLPAVKYIVEELEGDIQVASDPGRGAQFTVRVPLRTVEGDLDEDLHR